MKKVILYIASSLDGFIARDNGDINWLPESDTSGYDEFYKTINTVIMGKTTYEQVLTFGEYPYKDKKSYVFTRNNSISAKSENVEFVSNADVFVKDMHAKMKGNVWLVGGGQIISYFVNRGLVDEMILSIIPIVLGRGIPLFCDMQKESRLNLIKSTSYDKLIELHYQVIK